LVGGTDGIFISYISSHAVLMMKVPCHWHFVFLMN